METARAARRSPTGPSQPCSAALEVLGAGDILVVVTHGGTARATIGRLLGLPVEHWDVFGGLSNAAWSMLEETSSGSWRLGEHNAGTLPEPVVGDDV